MKKKILLTVLTGIILLQCSCKKSDITGPELQPGRRDYVWTVDTLNMPMNNIHSIWGSSPSDLWACGPGGSIDQWLQHYDGSKWTPYTKEVIWCAGTTLFGFSQNDVWLGGSFDGGEIWHYDGNSWKRNYNYKVDGAYDVVINNIWGSKPDDIYACGVIFYKRTVYEPESNKGFVLHYDGNSWTEVCKGEFNSQFLSTRKNRNRVFILSYSYSQVISSDDVIAFYELTGNKLYKIYSNTHGIITWGNFELFGDKLFFWMNRDVFIYKENTILSAGEFIKQFSISEPKYDYYIFGRNEKDVFISTIGGLAHYNGDDIQYIFNYPDSQRLTAGTILFKKDIFCSFVNFSTSTNMILHGHIKQ